MKDRISIRPFCTPGFSTTLPTPRIAVSGGAALDDITDINLAPIKLDGFDDAGQQLTGGPDKGQALLIFFKPGPFADKEQSGVGISVTKNNIISATGQLTAPTITQVCPHSLQGIL